MTDKYLCLMSHQQPLGIGKFKSFEAGKYYGKEELPETPEPALFAPGREESPVPRAKKTTSKEVKKDGD